jgi:7-carboxy-7-deazaguanine synthase
MDSTVITHYPVMEHFYTIQGEGFYTGQAAYFVRLGGCNVGCVWCDVKESWDAENHPKYEITEILNWILSSKAQLCVITGGEPAMYNLEPLVTLLKQNHIQINIETSGAYPLTGEIDWVCVSPKKFKAPVPEALAIANEYKVVVFHKSDIEWAMQFIAHLPQHCKLYLQPEWSKSDTITPLIIDFVKQNPQWQISLQTHKYLQIP